MAPAGFGKSVAIRQYLEADRVEHLTFAVRKEHATLAGFLRGFIAALEPIAPKASKSVAGAYEKACGRGAVTEDLASWVALLLRDYCGTIVIDDLRLDLDTQTLSFVAAVLEATSRDIRWVISARSVQGLPTASWLVYGDIDGVVDEEHLRISLDEASVIAESRGINRPIAEISEIVRITEGWPAAMTIGLDAFAHASDLKMAALGTRELSFDYLAEQVFRRLEARQQRFLLSTCLFPRIDLRLISQHDPSAKTMISELRRRSTFIVAESADIYRYYELFREFLEHELRHGDEARFQETVDYTGRILENSGNFDQALVLYCGVGRVDLVSAMLVDHGWELLDSSGFENVATGLAILGEGNRSTSHQLVSLAARVQESRGNFYESDALYRRSLDLAETSDAATAISEKLAGSLMNRFSFDEACSALRRSDPADVHDPGAAARLYALRAALHAFMGENDLAASDVRTALAKSSGLTDPNVRAVVLHRSAFVYLRIGQLSEARNLAKEALDLGRELGLFELCGRTCSLLYEVADAREDLRELESSLDQMVHYAGRCGDRSLRDFALFCRYDAAVERGNLDEILRLEPEILAEVRVEEERWAQTVVAAEAMKAAWRGEFRQAFAALVPWPLEKSHSGHRALRMAEIALFCAACLDQEASSKRVAAARDAVEQITGPEVTSIRVIKARILLGLALLLNGKARAATLELSILAKHEASQSEAIWVFLRAARQLCDWSAGRSDDAALKNAFEALARTRLGGYARLLHALVSLIRRAPRLDCLTPAEMRILRLLSAGRTSKEIASELGRSHLTVDTHVKTLLRKLGCGSRREAMALLLDQAPS